MGGLTEKQKRFADLYKQSGNGTDAYKMVYGTTSEATASTNASRLLRNAKVMAYLDDLEEKIQTSSIADMVEINAFWSAVMRNKDNELKDRLKASEYRAKVQGAFIDNVKMAADVVTIIDNIFEGSANG